MPITPKRVKNKGRGGLRFSGFVSYACSCAAVLAAQGAFAFELSLPSNARETFRESAAPASYAFPTGNLVAGDIPMQEVSGRVTRTAWRIRSDGLETLQMMAPLAEQLTAEGFTEIHRCAADRCGGYDFRFALSLIEAPDMFVDLFDYRYAAFSRPIAGEAIAPDPETVDDTGAQQPSDPAAAPAATRPPAAPTMAPRAAPTALTAAPAAAPAATAPLMEYVIVLVSRAGASGYIHLAQIAPIGSAAAKAALLGAGTTLDAPAIRPVSRPSAAEATEAAALPLPDALRSTGHAVLHDLSFETGSATLGEGPFATLGALAEMLLADASLRVALVGHTDAVGSLEGNIALSKRRAAAAVERLVSAYGVPRGQLDGEGMGYLSPRASNLTAEGRESNRRVEAVLLNAE